ncbi:NAD-dependent succinate-semialdehyde dehydrogenase [Metabacillus halosaccharovorans]|uniref:Aldehyde dehydrogenase n=1 Tax=Metabacillus halosaccharovorans TaxID=930124 RepID=A0ABT3DFP4_9BACI|nr:NAD-dependent succinate-semialdehyde dehydrogenase [Metabacillus halosaccharovorans]MCV9885759.1 NAD-dependent succinate-semialdehyde dehydrogenase [Metabacillus halosaccharovorans]
MYINGNWHQTDTTIDIENPATNEIIAKSAYGGKKEAAMAVEAAYDAFSSWSKLVAGERAGYLKKWYQLIDQHKEEIAKIMTSEQGKPLKEALGEVQYANSFIEWYAEEGKRIYGETIPSSHPNKRLFVSKQPIGVMAAITPWNFPAAMITRKVAPALAAGCTSVIKPAEQTPLTAIRLIELAHEAGIPKGVLNVVVGDAKEIGDVWLKDDRVRKISFTGSTEVGKLLMRGAADTVKKISLELGGHAPLIVLEDADLDQAVEGVISSKFRNAGQTCVCTNRVYVHQSIYEPFMNKLKDAFQKLRVGDGLQDQTTIGPLIDRNALKKVKNHLEDASNKGGDITYLGQSLDSENGYFMTPVIVGNASDDMLCMKEETFGPVAPVTTFETIEEVVKRANQSPYGLAAYVFTQNISKGIRIVEDLEYGIVGLNDGLPSVAQAPFGGFKESGLGREGGHYGIEEYLEVKYISLGL